MNAQDWPEGYARRMLGEVDSTNAEGLRRARQLAAPTWIFAERQLAGRGRRGRAWSDPDGNFAASLVLRPSEPAARAALRSFVAALALHDALSMHAPRAALALKWPNDVLFGGAKLAGILLEAVSDGARLDHLVIGFGVNLDAAPEGAASLRGKTGAAPAPEALLCTLAAAYARREADFVTGGFAPIRAAWLERAARLGGAITARTMRESVEGRFETVDAEGNLVLSTAEGRRAIPAADVYFQGEAG